MTTTALNPYVLTPRRLAQLKARALDVWYAYDPTCVLSLSAEELAALCDAAAPTVGLPDEHPALRGTPEPACQKATFGAATMPAPAYDAQTVCPTWQPTEGDE